eukprot:CAMPEP_0181383006 /NCGR_PEP_ID=MMETSP1106-20121128/21095_1 /TAXON_ID=81844 /ORGANISM="Mantoniella antarctica, Strain SL-175" /LENGTH=45 /DNA_ID= /DNA_START= /DNA_END= /DNA_ORIENTATION=
MGIALFRRDPATARMLDTWWEASENLTLARRTHELKVVRARKKKL